MFWEALPTVLLGLYLFRKASNTECEGETLKEESFPFKEDVVKNLSHITKLDGQGNLPLEFFAKFYSLIIRYQASAQDEVTKPFIEKRRQIAKD
jgi:hypothetical protein